MLNKMAERWGSQWAGWALILMRVVTGVIFAIAGWMKFQNMDGALASYGTIATFTAAGIPAATFFAYLVAIIELVGGIALIAGLWTRVAAKLLAIVMLVAFLLTLTQQGFFMAELPLVMFVLCFNLFCVGGGKYAMDK